jgi:hypothetical protein
MITVKAKQTANKSLLIHNFSPTAVVNDTTTAL